VGGGTPCLCLRPREDCGPDQHLALSLLKFYLDPAFFLLLLHCGAVCAGCTGTQRHGVRAVGSQWAGDIDYIKSAVLECVE
jgi:hypothetical protein